MLTSELLAAAGIRHGFSTREDGDARGEGIPRKLAASLGANGVATCTQVHGTAILWPDGPGRAVVEADGLASRGGLAVGVLSADCVPILLVDPGSGLCAAVHAGWRGTLAGVAAAGLEALCAAGARTEQVLVALGPRIKPCCYEVGEDLARRFTTRFATGVERRNSSVFLDLEKAIRVQLAEKGLVPEQVGALDRCTHCGRGPDGDFLFHSHRREGPAAGRQLSILSM
jgi:YfiH family protein